METLFIKNAKIVKSDKIIDGGVLVKDGLIVDITNSGEEREAENILDLEGKYLFPGLIDGHVHFDEPGYEWREDFYSGTEAAAIGGVTTIIDMPLNNKPPVFEKEVFDAKKSIVEKKALIDYGFWGALLNYNLDKLQELNDAGVLAFKSFMCNPGEDYTSLNFEEIEKAMNIIKKFNGFAGFHCEDYDIIEKLQKQKLDENKITFKDYLESRPVEAEIKAVKDVIDIAEKTKCRVHICHVSSIEVAKIIKEAKNKGINVTAETCPHYLIFNEDDVIKGGAAFKCSPPLRKKEDADKLWEYLLDGTIDSICSDHSPATLEEKRDDGKDGAFGAWGGMNSVQFTLQVMFDYLINQKKLSPSIIYKILSENPAKIFGIYGKKGGIEIGFDADFTIADPNKKWKITKDSLKTKTKESAFIGLEGKGKAVGTIVRGKIIVLEDKIVGEHGFGKLVLRK
ncbi:MAG: allantoinase AllB [Clostridium sp.]|nr:allantoinase AllB [Clostridium sp.]